MPPIENNVPGRGRSSPRVRRTDRFDHAHAAVSLDDGEIVQGATARREGGGRRGDPEHRTGIRIAEVRDLGADDDLASADRPEGECLQSRAGRAGAAPDQARKRRPVTTAGRPVADAGAWTAADDADDAASGSSAAPPAASPAVSSRRRDRSSCWASVHSSGGRWTPSMAARAGDATGTAHRLLLRRPADIPAGRRQYACD